MLGLTVLSIVLFVATTLVSQQSVLVLIVALTAVIVLHEFGHFLSMYFLGFQNVSMYLVPFVGGLQLVQSMQHPCRSLNLHQHSS